MSKCKECKKLRKENRKKRERITSLLFQIAALNEKRALRDNQADLKELKRLRDLTIGLL